MAISYTTGPFYTHVGNKKQVTAQINSGGTSFTWTVPGFRHVQRAEVTCLDNADQKHIMVLSGAFVFVSEGQDAEYSVLAEGW